MSGAARDEAVTRIQRVIAVVPGLREQLVFIGGTVLPIVADVEERFDEPRTTKDVDAVAATATYAAKHRIEEALRGAGFRDAPAGHMGRFLAPSGEVVDLSFAGDHAGGTGSPVDLLAVSTRILHAASPAFWHVSAAGLFLMKVAAFFDRGSEHPFASKDLADLAVLLAAKTAFDEEVGAGARPLIDAVSSAARRLLGHGELVGALRSHYADRRPIAPDTPDVLADEALARLARLRDLGFEAAGTS